MKIDAHIHFTPPELRDDLENFIAQEPYWGLLFGDGETSKQGWASPERMIRDMDLAGLNRVVIQGEYRRHHNSCVARNNQALDLIRGWPTRVMAFACLQPKVGPAAVDELKRCLDGGMSGVGELNPYGQGHSLTDPDFLRVVEACIEFDVPLNLHVNEEIGHYYPGKTATPLRQYYWLAETYPELKLILAHWGGGLIFYEVMPAVRRVLHNVWYDSAASPFLFPTSKIFNIALQCVDPQRILYGSDYPLLITRRQAEPDFRPFIAQIDKIGLEPTVYDDIMGLNMARLLGLTPAESRPRKPSRASKVITALDPASARHVTDFMAVSLIAETWPETRTIFDQHGIPWSDSPVPHWEPLIQAAAARGYNPTQQQRLVAELNEAIVEPTPSC